MILRSAETASSGPHLGTAVDKLPPIAIRSLSCEVHGQLLLDNVRLDIKGGEFVVVAGPNGAGKSTLLSLIAGLVPQRLGALLTGDIHIGARKVCYSAPGRSRFAGVSLVPQKTSSFADLSVHDNLLLSTHGLKFSPERLRDRLSYTYGLLPALAGKRGLRAGALSGGERQLLGLAIGLMPAPTTLLLDEPTLGLSEQNAALLFSAIRAIHAAGCTVIVVEHRLGSIHGLADRLIIVRDGKVHTDTAWPNDIDATVLASIYG